ncbi:MAG: metalloregulator ArsR/SmtB family transcription factor [Phycisphaerales bacterium JB039]
MASDPLALLAEPKRREILRLIWRGELSAGEIAARFDVSFGAISQHLAALREAGLGRRRRDGRRRLYSVDREGLGPIAGALEVMWGGQIERLKELAEAEQRAAPRPRRGRISHDIRRHPGRE